MDMTISDIWTRRSICESSVLKGSKDLHSHILPGVDDGIITLDESFAALAFEEELGVLEVWFTPHIMEEVSNDSLMLKEKFSQFQEIYRGPMTLHLAAEYMLDNLFLERLYHRDLLTIRDDIILVEMSSAGAPYGFAGILADTIAQGYQPMLAHPERYIFMKENEYFQLRKMGVLFQLNIASLTGYYGKDVRVRSEFLLKKGMYHTYGSDCHSIKSMKLQYTENRLAADILRRIALMNDNF
jgi:tyrosine-protein phosphatase YwqE